MVKAMAIAVRATFFMFVLMLMFIYVFAILFTVLFKNSVHGAGYFDDVPDSVRSLFVHAILPDQAEFLKAVAPQGPLTSILLVSFFFLTAITIMNMLIGVLVQVVNAVAAVEKEEYQMQFLKEELAALMLECGLEGPDGNPKPISLNNLIMLLQWPETSKVLERVNIDVDAILTITQYVFGASEEVQFDELIALVLQLRGTNHSTVKDIVDLRQHMSHCFLLSQQMSQGLAGITDPLLESPLGFTDGTGTGSVYSTVASLDPDAEGESSASVKRQRQPTKAQAQAQALRIPSDAMRSQ
jgi:hypothetical protein